MRDTLGLIENGAIAGIGEALPGRAFRRVLRGPAVRRIGIDPFAVTYGLSLTTF